MVQFVEEYVPVNGIEHFLLHCPQASGAPVLLYLHGGPGSFESLFAYKLEGVWGDLFTHAHWDRRGAGKTLRRNKKAGMPETPEQMLDDPHGVAGHLRRKYQTEKIVRRSWGSLLGSLYAQRHPENVLSYIGVGQVVGVMENGRIAFQETLGLAKKAGNQKHLHAMEKMGDCPSDGPGLLLKRLPKMRNYILGEMEAIAPLSLATAYFDTIGAPYKTIAAIPGAGHNPVYGQPAAFAAALRAVRETL